MAVYICTCIEKTIYLDFKTFLLTLRNKGYRYTGVYIYLDLTQVYFQMTLSFSVNQTEELGNDPCVYRSFGTTSIHNPLIFYCSRDLAPFSYHRYSSYSVLLLISPQKFRRSLSAYIKNI